MSFFFGLCIFLIGKYLQKKEGKRSLEVKSAEARRLMYFSGEAARSALRELRQNEFFPGDLGGYPGGEPGAQPGKIGQRTQ